MRKHFLLKTMLLLCALIVGSSSAWAEETPEVTLDFTSQNNWNIPTSGTNTSLASFTNGTYTIKLYATTNYKLNSGYLILGKKDSYLELPAFSFDVEKIEVVGTSGASESVGQNIYVGNTAVSTATTSAKNVTNSYTIATDYQAAGNVYKLMITTAHNTQISYIKIYKKATASANATTITIDDSGISNTNKFINTAAGSLSATVQDKNGQVIDGATVTWASQKESVAKIASDGSVTLVGAGTTQITASYAGVENQYDASSATYTLTVTNDDPTWIDFTKQGYTNAQDVVTVAGDFGSVTFDIGSNSQYSPKWYDSGSAIRVYADNTITINAKPGFVMTSVEFSVTSGSMSVDKFSANVTKVDNTNEFKLETPASEITYTPASTVRINKVKINIAAPVTISSVNWSTFSSPFALNFTDYTDASAYMVTSASSETLTLAKVEGTVPANIGLLISGTASETVNIPVVANSTTDVTDNKLKPGTGDDVNADDKYVLVARSGKAVFVPTDENAATVPVGKAYLDLDGVTLARGFILDDSETTGIADINRETITNNGSFYNLAGQRVAQPTKGMYIVNGRKVVIK